MRHYSKKEQNIINQILEIGKNTSSSNNMLFSVYKPIFEFYKVNINNQGLYFDSKQTPETITLIESDIAIRSLLIDDLIKDRLIKLVKVGSNLPFSYMRFRNNNLHDKIDSSIFDTLKDSFYSKVFVSQELYDLVSNKFKTYEDIQLEEARKQTEKAQDSFKEAQKQTRWSIGAVCLSILTLIASIVMPIILSKCSTDPIENKMEKSQFDSIQSKQNELINTLYPLKNIKITNDSLIKELNLANESINEISNTLKEIKELNSKRK